MSREYATINEREIAEDSRTPPAWMRFAHLSVIAEGGSIPLHWMATQLCTWWQN
jgi:hypothetical protein